MLFEFEPTESQQVAEAGPSLIVEEPVVIVEEEDQLTAAERDAEPPVAPVVGVPPLDGDSKVASDSKAVSDPVVAKVQTPDNAQPVQAVPVVKAPAKKPVVVKPEPVVAKSPRPTVKKHKQVATSSRVTRKTAPVRIRPAQTPRKTVAKAPKRMHPDDLPGAILDTSRNLSVSRSIGRSSKARATTPYGMAEQAFLDGKWALEQQRDDLAVRSLQHALELYPGHLPARELLVETLSKDGKTGEAMFLLAEGLEIAPDYIVFKKSYARLLVDQGDYDTATKVMLHGGLPTVEDDPEAHVILASLYQRLGESFLAAQTYRNLLVAWPQTGAFWVGLGGALEGQNLSGEAVECYQIALKTKDLRQDLSSYAKKRLNSLK
ncbi:MAG: hypothetical protein DRH08_11460 [Deltaproteobacteria bacterium]|nr:MAG: hypothetical protein DRH08_11460 [Deltaproteobacteria bacterium]